MNPFPSHCSSSSFTNWPSFGDQAVERSFTEPHLLDNLFTMDVDGDGTGFPTHDSCSDSDYQRATVSNDKTPSCEYTSDITSSGSFVTYADTPHNIDTTLCDISEVYRDFLVETLSQLRDLDLFVDVTPTPASSSSSHLVLTPTSPFRRDMAAVAGEAVESTEVDAFSEFLRGTEPGCGALDLTWVDVQTPSMSPLMDTTASGEASFSPMSWDWALPIDLPHFHTLDDVDVDLPTYTDTADIPLNFSPSSTTHSPITHVSSVNTFVSPTSSSATSSQSEPYAHPEPHPANRRPHSLPLFQPQPIRPIPLIPLDDLALTASNVVHPSSHDPTRAYPHHCLHNGESTRHSKSLSTSSLSPTSLLCQPVSCAVRHQGQKYCVAAKGQKEQQCDLCSRTA
jgi:hypothetical protein